MTRPMRGRSSFPLRVTGTVSRAAPREATIARPFRGAGGACSTMATLLTTIFPRRLSNCAQSISTKTQTPPFFREDRDQGSPHHLQTNSRADHRLGRGCLRAVPFSGRPALRVDTVAKTVKRALLIGASIGNGLRGWKSGSFGSEKGNFRILPVPPAPLQGPLKRIRVVFL
jgi:hypothetical protein